MCSALYSGIPRKRRKMAEDEDKQGARHLPHVALKGRLLAIDLGRRRVGLALSDELGLTTRALPPFERSSWKKLVQALSDIIQSFDVRELVIGLPLRLDGTEGEAASEARKIAQNLQRTFNLPVHLQDERLTSKAAEDNLRASGVRRDELANYVDGESARIILQDYFSRQNI